MPIGELQPLDIGEAVNAVAAGNVVDHRNNVVGGARSTVGAVVNDYGVLRLGAREGCRIEVGAASQDLAHDRQLTGVPHPFSIFWSRIGLAMLSNVAISGPSVVP